MKHRPQQAPFLEDNELLIHGPHEADLGELKRWHDPAFRDHLVDALLNVAGLADATDPDPTALLHAVNPPSERQH